MPTIYITEANSELKVQNEHLMIFHQQKFRYAIPLNKVSQIILFQRCHLPREVASLALFRRIPVLFLINQGEDVVQLERDSRQQAKYLTQQVKRSLDFEFTKATAESIVWATMHNSYILLQQLTNYYSTTTAETAINFIELLMDDLPLAHSINELWGYHTTAASFYYPALGSVLQSGFNFKKRVCQGAIDPINSLLNLGYALLKQTIYVFVQDLGLNPELGNLHLDCNNSAPLVCDLMSEWSAPLVDELVVSLAAAEVLTPEDFAPKNGRHGVYLYPEALKLFLNCWEKKLQTLVTHPLAGKVSYRHCLELQVREYIACLLGDVDFYRPMLFSANTVPLSVYSQNKQETEQPVLVKL